MEISALLPTRHHFFAPDTVDLHNEPEQLKRQEGISAFDVMKVDKVNFTATIKKKNHHGEPVLVSLSGCSCDDFRFRQKPCIHMYAFAANRIKFDDQLSIKFFTVKNERSEDLIADFSKGYADGWAFIVRPCNYLSLDIKWMPKTVKKETFMQLTQGNVYNFSCGAVFYDTITAYETSWTEALKSISCSLQITKTVPTYTVPVVVLNDENLLERRDRPVYGQVYFDVFRPAADLNKEEKIASLSCRQDEFLHLLRTGTFSDPHGGIHHLLEEKPYA